MSFFSNTLRINGDKKRGLEREDSDSNNLNLDFSLRNYAKRSFSLLVTKPFSKCAMKITRSISLIIMGASAGIAIALLCFAIFLQFGSVENVILSSFIQGRFEKLLPDSDLSLKSAALYWNPKEEAVEIVMNKVRLDDLSIPKVSILPDYKESFERRRLTLKNIALTNPKINISVDDDFKSVSLNPNFEKGGSNKELFEPTGAFDKFSALLEDGVAVKLINANVSIAENGVNWEFKNVYCEHKIGEKFPTTVDCSASFPGQGYMSNIGISRSAVESKTSYNVKIESLNPHVLISAFAKRNIPVDGRIFAMIDGYSLPVSGTLKLDFDKTKFLGGKFDLIGSAGSIKLPTKNTFSLNLGKKIDNGSVSGSFTANKAIIDSINVFYGNSGLQLTGINVPLSEFKFLDTVNVDGTLSLTNIDVNEMESILPETVCDSAISMFRNYLPGFKLELFKVDMRGPIAFGNRSTGDKMAVGKGVFKVKGAQIPLGEHLVKNVDASGTVSSDGVDIRLTNAVFEKIKVNSGTFFLSNKDNSWIGKVNADVPIDDISPYARDISPKLASLPIEKMHIKGLANFDMKLVQVDGAGASRRLPFKILEGEGVVRSDNNTKELRIFWNNEKLLVSGDVATDKNKINVKLSEDFASSSGKGEFMFASNSDFLSALIPGLNQICEGDYVLKINSSWKDRFEKYDLDLNLKGAIMNIPLIGDVKFRKDDGRFVAHISNRDGNLEFSKMSLDTKDNKISGKMTLDKKGNLLKCSLDEFEVNKNSAKINILREGGNLLCSAVGDSLDLGKALSFFDRFDKDQTASVYLNLKEATISNARKIRNVKGSLDLKGGKITRGACYAVIGDDTTLALTAKDVANTNDVLLTLSASNAGEFLKYMQIADTVSGGNINIVIKSSKNGNQSYSGAFEISDFIVKNNPQLTKLISLSSSAWLPNFDGLSVGFNFCSGNFGIAGDEIIVEEGKAIGPTMAISFNGSYDRAKDDLTLSGISLPMSAIWNNQNMNGALAANYKVMGSIGTPALSVKPLQFVENETLDKTFGNTLSLPAVPARDTNRDASYNAAPLENSSDPFGQRAFDSSSSSSEGTTTASKQPAADNRFGIKIVRGRHGT